MANLGIGPTFDELLEVCQRYFRLAGATREFQRVYKEAYGEEISEAETSAMTKVDRAL